MKKILFITAVSCSLLAGCNSFTINGTIEGVTEGNAYLVAYNEPRTGDTIAVAPISAKGKFSLTGKIKDIQLSAIRVDGKTDIFPLLLEKGTYTATITTPLANGERTRPGNSLVANIEGGAVQQVYKQFNDIMQELSFKYQGLQTAYFSTTDPTRKDSIERLFYEYQKEFETRELDLVKANPDSYATAFHLYNYAIQGLSVDDIKEKYDLLGAKGKTTKYGKQIEEQIQLMENVSVGRSAPDFKLVTPGEDSLSLHGVNAKLKLIDFWASWCGPCRAENPNVLEAYATYQPKGLEIIGISLDTDRKAWLKAVTEDQLPWKHCFDPTGKVAKLYGVSTIPHTILLDENNKIIAKNLRGDALKEKLSELLD
ncbi:MAG: AhpC/TSA family protein [Odoribacteraceae bacterium]|jgi:peroxiredoxin|nr:AhpC/TSA family protein [Odoribacteraceae bacterium]